MSIDPKLREELMQRLSERNIKRRRWHYYRKMIMWDVMLGFSLGLKRLLDILGSLAGIILLSPVFIFTALAIVVENPGPVFYSQTRVGHNGREFPFFKFRSMVVGADKMKDQLLEQNESGAGVIFKMKKDPRITRVGSFIRRFSIDELPQLLNVLKGDMSLVGPRPPIPREVAEYTLEDRKRLHIKPGITCIWQVSGRSDIPFDQQVELDKQYILSKSLFTDIKILVLTVPAVLTGKGAY
jgi:lipopolysaccharide/colanic/teichoic acid biosynthesis glycosyltransferase